MSPFSDRDNVSEYTADTLKMWLLKKNDVVVKVITQSGLTLIRTEKVTLSFGVDHNEKKIKVKVYLGFIALGAVEVRGPLYFGCSRWKREPTLSFQCLTHP